MTLEEILKEEDKKRITVEELDPEKPYIVYVDVDGISGERILQEAQNCMQSLKEAGIGKTIFLPRKDGKVVFDVNRMPRNQIEGFIEYLQSLLETKEEE